MVCAEEAWRRASAVSNGKPTTTPRLTSARPGRSLLTGRGCRNASSSTSPSNAAMLARAAVTKLASSSITAMRVAGKEPAKITTPMKPLIHPLADRSTPCSRSTGQ